MSQNTTYKIRSKLARLLRLLCLLRIEKKNLIEEFVTFKFCEEGSMKTTMLITYESTYEDYSIGWKRIK